MDATVLVVLKKPQPMQMAIPPPSLTPIGASRDKREANAQNENNDPTVGLGFTMCQTNVPGSCGSAVRIRCAETAVADELTCTTCCQLASKIENFPTGFIRGMLVDSTQFNKAPMESIRKKRLAPLSNQILFTQVPVSPPLPPSCASKGAPCPTVKCMCCGPRLPFPQLTPLLPAIPLQVAPVSPPLPISLMPQSIPFGPIPMANVVPYPVTSQIPPLFPYTGQANPSANGPKQK
uniref:Pollen Ole e 1 allergen and extensin family protein n=1 Tax=Syphacia muris TaxID=451379 RepID=A0A0N5A7Z6_9BILA